jgi:hypothetical protein
MTPRFLVFFVFSVLAAIPAIAQTGGRGAQNTLLPEINPQDIEIRSEFRARFPGLRRQPILGFNPKPRVFQIDPNRMPFMESKEEAVANVAITQLDRPEPPARAILNAPLRRNAYLRTGIGNFVSPEAEGYFFQEMSGKSTLSGNVDFRSSNGHLDDQLSGFRFFDGDLRFNTQTNNGLKIGTGLGFVSDFNRMFDIDPFYQDPVYNFGETAQKTYNGGAIHLSAEKNKNVFRGWRSALTATTYAASLRAGTTNLTGDTNEQTVRVVFANFWPGKRLNETFKLSGEAKAGSYKYTGLITQNWILTSAGIEYQKMLNFNAHINAKADVAYVNDRYSSRPYIAPELELSYNLKKAISIRAYIAGRPEMRSIQDQLQQNRFLVAQTDLRHSYTSEAFAELVFQPVEGNRIYGGLNYQVIKNYAWYDRAIDQTSFGDFKTFFAVNFDKANIFEFFGGITQQLAPNKFWFDARVYLRDHKLDSGGKIPFEENLGVHGSLAYLPFQKLKVTTWAQYMGSRNAPASNRELGGFVLLNGAVEYEINNHFGLYAKVLNMLGQKYEIWDGYQERPFQVFGGLILKL